MCFCRYLTQYQNCHYGEIDDADNADETAKLITAINFDFPFKYRYHNYVLGSESSTNEAR